MYPTMLVTALEAGKLWDFVYRDDLLWCETRGKETADGSGTAQQQWCFYLGAGRRRPGRLIVPSGRPISTRPYNVGTVSCNAGTSV